MNIEMELKKLTIAHRLCLNCTRLHPTACRDYGKIGVKYDTYHNQRAFLINRLEDYNDHEYVVKFDKVTHTATILDRLEYLADFDRLYELYD